MTTSCDAAMQPVIKVNLSSSSHSRSETQQHQDAPQCDDPLHGAMTSLQLLLLYCCWDSALSLCLTVDGFSCFTSYKTNVTCVLNISRESNASYSLKFTTKRRTFGVSECPLVVLDEGFGCVCRVAELRFMEHIPYRIDFCDESSCCQLDGSFFPAQNIQPTPPLEPRVVETLGGVNVSWESGYNEEKGEILGNFLRYEISLQTHNNARSLTSVRRLLPVSSSDLQPGASYCVKVRSKTNQDHYKSTWSKWSPSTCWRNADAAEPDNTLSTISIRFLGPVCVTAVVLLFILYNPATLLRLMKSVFHTPSPAPFFQPLFQQHDGNLQDWLSPRRTFVLPYKTEETLTTDTFTMEPKPETKDPEENREVLSPGPLPLTQCQTSYVGLPGLHQAPPPVTPVCPGGETSYTVLPCSVWGVPVDNVFSAPPEDSFEISREDSGCNLEDLSQSCDSPAESPVEEILPPFCCTDYCILNKTAAGFAPVIVSKGQPEGQSVT